MTKVILILTLNDPHDALNLGEVENSCYKLIERLVTNAGNFYSAFINWHGFELQ